MLPSDIKDLYKSYQSIYQQEDDDISSEMIEEIVEELVEECLEFGYTLDEATNAIQEAAELYFDAEELEEAKVTYGSDTESPEERTARAKERLGGRKATARKAAVKGAVDRVTAKAKGIKAGAEIAGSIAKDEARRAGRGALHAVGKAASAVASAPGKAYKAVTDAARAKKAEVKQGVKSLLGRGLRKAAGAAGVVAQKARKAGAAAGKAAERLGEEIISEDPVQDFRDMKRAKENAAGMRGPELSHSAKPAGFAKQKPQKPEPRSKEFSHGGSSTKPTGPSTPGYDTRRLGGYDLRRLANSYEPEGNIVDEATRMRKELGKEGETAVRKELAVRSKGFKRSGSVDKTITAAERGADNPYVSRGRNETESEYNKRKQDKSKTLRTLASNRRKSVRGESGLRGYAAKVSGDDKELQLTRGSARSAGTLTPAEKKRLGEEFDLWVNALIYEGYDLSDYTWDEIIEIYEETEEERKRNERKARVAELHASGRVMTSSKRASQKATQRKQDKQEEMADRLLRSIQASGSTRSSSAPMGTTEPEEKPEAPAANRRLGGKVKKDDLASQANAILRTIKNENIQLWVNELINEGYDLTGWTGKEITKLYFEIFE